MEVYIKYVRAGTGGYKFFEKYFVARRSIGLNISWSSNFFENNFTVLPLILVFFIALKELIFALIFK